ncbi:SpoIIE family protein phosphatase [Streptomyces sp. NPDC058291]|uniref:SpoIIE family protein phosphatase n=1 Tax=Streptomyces sp. NPDC058291 TaxID=3346427 RepID=UPI0036EA7BE5
MADLGEDRLATLRLRRPRPRVRRVPEAGAGHPPPVVVSPGGAIAFLDGSPGTPLGTGGRQSLTEEVPLPPGGLARPVHRRADRDPGRGPRSGVARLARALRRPGRPLTALCDDALARMPPYPAQDDIAVLTARPQGPPRHARQPGTGIGDENTGTRASGRLSCSKRAISVNGAVTTWSIPRGTGSAPWSRSTWTPGPTPRPSPR